MFVPHFGNRRRNLGLAKCPVKVFLGFTSLPLALLIKCSLSTDRESCLDHDEFEEFFYRSPQEGDDKFMDFPF